MENAGTSGLVAHQGSRAELQEPVHRSSDSVSAFNFYLKHSKRADCGGSYSWPLKSQAAGFGHWY